MASLRAPCVRAPQAILAERRSRARAGMARGAPPSTHACGIFQQATASGHPREDCDSPWLPTRPFCTLQSTWFARQEPSVRCRSPLQTARTSRASCRSPLRSGQWPSAWCSSPLFSAHPVVHRARDHCAPGHGPPRRAIEPVYSPARLPHHAPDPSAPNPLARIVRAEPAVCSTCPASRANPLTARQTRPPTRRRAARAMPPGSPAPRTKGFSPEKSPRHFCLCLCRFPLTLKNRREWEADSAAAAQQAVTIFPSRDFSGVRASARASVRSRSNPFYKCLLLSPATLVACNERDGAQGAAKFLSPPTSARSARSPGGWHVAPAALPWSKRLRRCWGRRQPLDGLGALSLSKRECRRSPSAPARMHQFRETNGSGLCS